MNPVGERISTRAVSKRFQSVTGRAPAIIALLSLTLGLVGRARAADIFPPPLQAQDTNDLNCRVLNTSSTTAAVAIEIRNHVGGLIASCQGVAIGAGTTNGCTTAPGAGIGWCKVSGISKT